MLPTLLAQLILPLELGRSLASSLPPGYLGGVLFVPESRVICAQLHTALYSAYMCNTRAFLCIQLHK